MTDNEKLAVELIKTAKELLAKRDKIYPNEYKQFQKDIKNFLKGQKKYISNYLSAEVDVDFDDNIDLYNQDDFDGEIYILDTSPGEESKFEFDFDEIYEDLCVYFFEKNKKYNAKEKTWLRDKKAQAIFFKEFSDIVKKITLKVDYMVDASLQGDYESEFDYNEDGDSVPIKTDYEINEPFTVGDVEVNAEIENYDTVKVTPTTKGENKINNEATKIFNKELEKKIDHIANNLADYYGGGY